MKSLFTLFFFCGICLPALAQDPDFSQFYNQPMYVNPAFTGLNEGIRIGSLYRNLWSRIPGTFNTFNLSAEMQALPVNSGFGLIANNDVEGEGELHSTELGGLYSYRILVDPRNFVIQAGVQTSVISQSINWNKLVFSDMLDPTKGLIYPTAAPEPPQSSKAFLDVDAGALARFNLRKKRRAPWATGTFGFAVHHITQPDQSLMGMYSRLPYKVSVHAGLVIPYRVAGSNTKNVIAPAFLYEKQAQFQEFLLGCNVMKEPFYAGVFYRDRNVPILNQNTDALIADLGFVFKHSKTEEFRFGYSYDVTINDLRGSSPGTHEVSLSMVLLQKEHKPGKKRQDCFSF